MHLDNLSDSDEKLVIAVQDSLITLIQYKMNFLDKFLDEIIPIVSLTPLLTAIVALKHD